jgi:acetyl esterase
MTKKTRLLKNEGITYTHQVVLFFYFQFMTWKLKLVLLFAKLRPPLDVHSPDIKKMRKESEKASRLGTRLFDKDVPVRTATDISADGVPVRIYRNNDGKGQRVLIYYHGGGFVLYGLESHHNVCKRLAAMNNCIVVSVDYRLAPEHSFPAAHEDAFTVLNWVLKNISEYGGNPGDIFVAGDSAGGNLSACMAHRCKKEGIKLKGQILVYPWIDGKLNNPSIDRNGDGYLLTKETIFWFQKQYTPNPEDHCNPLVSPKYENEFSGLAPAFVLTAQYDPLIDDGLNYYNQLKEGGNKVHYQEYPNLIHGFFNIPGVAPEARKAYHDIAAFMKEL